MVRLAYEAGLSSQHVFLGELAISTHLRKNEQIRISPVRLIDHLENQAGIVPTAEAMRTAREAGLDLVEVAPTARPPVCRIMDYGKYLYQQQKKQDKSRSHSKAGQLKELKIKTVRIGDHDLEIKTNHARQFLEEGNKVQFTLQFKGREMAHTELGREIFIKIKRNLADCCKVERDAKMEGRRMTLVLQPDSKGSAAASAPAAKPAAGGLRPAAAMSAGSTLGIKPPQPVTAGS